MRVLIVYLLCNLYNIAELYSYTHWVNSIILNNMAKTFCSSGSVFNVYFQKYNVPHASCCPVPPFSPHPNIARPSRLPYSGCISQKKYVANLFKKESLLKNIQLVMKYLIFFCIYDDMVVFVHNYFP